MCHLVVTSISVSQNIIWNTELRSTEAEFRKLLRICYFELQIRFTEQRNGFDRVTEGMCYSTDPTFLCTSQQMLLRWHRSLKDFTPRTMHTQLMMPTYKKQGNMKRQLILCSKMASRKSAARGNYRGKLKRKHESSIKIFYNHRIT